MQINGLGGIPDYAGIEAFVPVTETKETEEAEQAAALEATAQAEKAAKQQRLREIAAQYDPRNLSFNERTRMVQELHQAGLMTTRTMLTMSLHLVPPGYEPQDGESQEAYVGRLQELRTHHSAFNQPINQLASLQYNMAIGGGGQPAYEMHDLYTQIVRIREADPDLSKQRPDNAIVVDPTKSQQVMGQGWSLGGLDQLIEPQTKPGNKYYGNDALTALAAELGLLTEDVNLSIKMIMSWVLKDEDEDKTPEQQAAGSIQVDGTEPGDDAGEATEASSANQTKPVATGPKSPTDGMELVITYVEDPAGLDPLNIQKIAKKLLGLDEDADGTVEGAASADQGGARPMLDPLVVLAQEKARTLDRDLAFRKIEDRKTEAWAMTAFGFDDPEKQRAEQEVGQVDGIESEPSKTAELIFDRSTDEAERLQLGAQQAQSADGQKLIDQLRGQDVRFI